MPTTRHGYAYPTTPVTGELITSAREWETARHAEGMRQAEHDHGGLVGFIGEIVALEYLATMGVPHRHVDATSADVAVPGGTLEIKTRRRSAPLLPHYEFEVPAYNHAHQTVTWFLFVDVQYTGPKTDPDYTVARIAGTCTRTELHDHGEYRTEPVGDVLPSRFIPGWRIQAQHLTPVELMVREWRNHV